MSDEESEFPLAPPLSESLPEETAEALSEFAAQAKKSLKDGQRLVVTTPDGMIVERAVSFGSGLLLFTGQRPDGSPISKLIHHTNVELNIIVVGPKNQDTGSRRIEGFNTRSLAGAVLDFTFGPTKAGDEK